jgi:ferritin-like metal-binding protein YciE
MAEAGTLQDAFIDELRDAYDGERQLTKALAKLAKAATAPELKEAFQSHLEETQGQIERLEQVFATLEEKARGKHCDGIAGIIEEGKAIMEEDFDDATMDASLIAAGQRAEHYEMAAYGTLVAWARALGHDEAAELLQQTLDEEKAADEKLSGLAEGGINQSAADSVQLADESDDEEDDSEEDEDDDEDDNEDDDNEDDDDEDAEEEAGARPVRNGTEQAGGGKSNPGARRR